jgi:hypothetical protein
MDLTGLGCGEMGDVLNHPRFSELQEVRIDIQDNSGKKDETIAWVRKEMTCLDNRNILTVNYLS